MSPDKPKGSRQDMTIELEKNQLLCDSDGHFAEHKKGELRAGAMG